MMIHEVTRTNTNEHRCLHQDVALRQYTPTKLADLAQQVMIMSGRGLGFLKRLAFGVHSV